MLLHVDQGLLFPRSSSYYADFHLVRKANGKIRTSICFPRTRECSCVIDEHKGDIDSCPRSKGTLVFERRRDGTTRYVLDDLSLLVAVVEDHSSIIVDRPVETHSGVSWLPRYLKDFILPAGFPGSVSSDYLQYMLLQFPTNVTGWICHTLVTSSLLKAVGLTSVSGTTTAVSTAAIRWVSKDGLGAVGRLFVGGRFGTLFDDDPKLWRMYADFIGSAGSIFELATQIYPAYFFPLASVGNLAKALAKGFKDPSFRVIQNHFAVSGNLGEVAAKEEVWEVAAQLLGLTMGILILSTPGVVTTYPLLVMSWLSLRLLHLWLRYHSLMALRFPTINLKRARILVHFHVLDAIVPGCADCNKEENILIHQRFLKPRILFGVSLCRILGTNCSINKLKDLLELYDGEDYILATNPCHEIKDLEVLVSFKVGATSTTVLRSLWQAYWLYENWKGSSDLFHQLGESLSKLEERFEDFLKELEAVGWDLEKINIKVPTEFLLYTSTTV